MITRHVNLGNLGIQRLDILPELQMKCPKINVKLSFVSEFSFLT